MAHGADAVCFFQWRQSAAGAEKYHSAMLPTGGRDTDVFREVTALGGDLSTLEPVVGAGRKPARAAILFDWQSWWVSGLDSHPSSRLDYRQEALDWYSAFLAVGARVDVVPVAFDLSGYELVVAPILHVVPAALAARLASYVDGGGHLVTTYFSGIVDENDHLWPGAYPGALRDLLGIRVEEFAPLLDGDSVALDSGVTGTLWTDRLTVAAPDVSVLARYPDGGPAITRRVAGGSATYVSTRLGPAGLAPLLSRLGVRPELPDAGGRVEVTVRTDGADEFWFVINRTDDEVAANLDGDVLLGALPIPPRGVTVIRRRAATTER